MVIYGCSYLILVGYTDFMSDMDSRKSTFGYVFTRVGRHRTKYHPIREIVRCGNIIVTNVTSIDNIADPFTKAFQLHKDRMDVRCDIL